MRTAFCLLFSFVIGANCAISTQNVTTPYPYYQTTRNSNCPSGYSDKGDGSCYSCCDSYTARNYAYNRCAHDGGYLNDINNIYQNIDLQSLAGYSDIWLGLTCLTNDRTSCVWDGTGIALNTSSYSNFYGGSPNITEGPCVYMKGSDAKWYSADCMSYYAFSGCKYTPGIKVPYCSPSSGDGYSDTFAFRGKCYWNSRPVPSYNDGAYSCARSCGSMASIHSIGENNFIRSLANYKSYEENYIFTGLKNKGNTGNYSWNDHSKYDYSNFGYENIQMGYCVLMSMYTDLIPSGTWINSGCEQTLKTICSKDWQNACDTTTTPIPTTTAAPVICPSSQFFTGNGTIYSPGYPNGMDSTNCEYLITVNQGQFAQIYFPEINLNWASNLTFYSDVSSQKPFKTLIYQNTRTIVVSPTNIIRMYFSAIYNDGSSWIGVYGPAPNYMKCSSTYFYSNSGTLSSPDYPQGSEIPNSCDYVITVNQGQQAEIYFTDLVLNYDSKLSFYSSITSNYPFQTVTYSSYGIRRIDSSTNVLKIVYNTTGDGSYWSGNYGPYGPSLTTTTDSWWGYTTQSWYPLSTTSSSTNSNCGKSYYYSGTITSQNFPSPYPQMSQSCSNTLNAMQYVTCIVFDTMDLRYYDYVTLYDGYEYTELEIARFTGYDSAPGVYCSRYYSAITLVFTTSSNSCCSYQKGFSARFAADAASLDGTRTTYETPTTTTWYWLANKKAN